MATEQSKKPRRDGHITNLASEFYVMSVLYRLSFEAHLTLGNKKAVDIVVVRAPGEAITIDVKGVAERMDWPAGNIASVPRERHFFVLVTYKGKFDQTDVVPESWIFSHEELLPFVKSAKPPSKMKYVPQSAIRKTRGHQEAWDLLKSKGKGQEPPTA